jgi:valyl-tRNA synthetase
MKLSKNYEPAQYENDIYALWEQREAYKPKKAKAKDSYTIVMPPPNANGNLHLGHALTVAIEDIAARYQRMQGKQVLYLPGADHAGFETQSVYEKQLEKVGKSRFEFTREQLYAQIWDFVQINKGTFEKQVRALGASVDWSRFCFTLDTKIVNTAYNTFQKMWEDGLIYRGERLVNFCTKHGTAFADIEVEYKDLPGKLWNIHYQLTDGSGEIVVATTRPETMLGDTAIAVHPDDARYTAFHGKTVKLPLTEREIPIIVDTMVEMSFGTGAVKITPAHDSNDFEAGQRHNLPMVTVITSEGKIAHESIPVQYAGLTLEDARAKILTDLKAIKAIGAVESISHSVGHCYKCGTVIQPLLRDQWFVAMTKLAQPAIAALKANKIKFYPESRQVLVEKYLGEIRDWNISRQIAWGIPIPAFQNVDNPDDWIFDQRVEQEFLHVGPKTYRRDPDVFDTWFSSGQWPFATLQPGSEDFEQFYPTAVMETGVDLLQQWVSRMIMLGLYATGEVPFREVYFHGMVLDEHGAKMSKSKGNVVNPIDIISEYGSDALRMGVLSGQTAGNNQPFGIPKVVAARNFCNKLWNIARYAEGVLPEDYDKPRKPELTTSADHWIIGRLTEVANKMRTQNDRHCYAESYQDLYHLVWDDFADWYLESTKANLNKSVLCFALETILKLTQPYAPFLCETIWQTLAWEEGSLIVEALWPELPEFDKNRADQFEEVQKVVIEVRAILLALNTQKVTMYHLPTPFLVENAKLITKLSKLEGVIQVSSGRGLHLTQTSYKAWLDIDMQTAKSYLDNLDNQLREHLQSKTQLESRLSNKSYVDNAPKKIVDQTKSQLDTIQSMIDKISVEREKFDQATSGI